jgi:hypothetical protein
MEKLLNQLADQLLNILQPPPNYLPLPIPIRSQRRFRDEEEEDEE